ncbi:universal stress protein [Desulfobacula toluolica]|uniref:Uncharacterized universal stress protein n=1 Tax=Desulfobacula toluolica (strain DSM 7467 / Tol2) TaxID=651182 RepID=K0NIV1_DESTT|nr:universal stress protein [Desulfobacula toluolica]CCK79753.1 uncharacterized universal stress protein [Desulfobacula toluolica Tol2]
MFKHILVATDRVSRADAPVLTALDLAGQYHAKLTVLHVLEPGFTSNTEQVSPDYTETIKTKLHKTYESDVTYSHIVRFTIRTGCPWKEILNEAHNPDTDLIILGPHSKQTEKKEAVRKNKKIGNTARKILTRKNCPMMIINKPIAKEKLKFQKIIVGIDFSISCECALCLSVKLSRDFNSILYPFFMIPIPPYPKYNGVHYKTDMDALTKKLEEFCDVYLDGTEHEYKIWGGALPHQEVLKCAEKTDADLIILGSHTKNDTGKNYAGKWYAGSVVERVSFRADCPVLVLNDPKALEKWHDIQIPDQNRETATDRSINLFHLKKRKGPSAC